MRMNRVSPRLRAVGVRLLAAWLGCAAMSAVQAQSSPERQRRFQEAVEAAQKAGTRGPADVTLAGQATLHLPAQRLFVPAAEAGRLLNAMGNPGTDPNLQGMVVSTGDDDWFVTVRFEPSGYVKDDDAKDWNADDLLKSYREGTDAANTEREKMGVPGLEIVGWAEKPAYDAATHRLVWAMSSREKGSSGAAQGVNYNTYALGREGYFTMNLVTELAALPQHKPVAQALLGGLDFNDGKRYADFNEKTDHVAEYGLAALVVGVAAKKLGLIAIALGLFAKFAKVAVLGVALLGAGVAKLFKRKRKRQADEAPAALAAPVASADPPPPPPAPPAA